MGTILVFPDEEIEDSGLDNNVHIYARVSSQDQKGDLERQVQRIRDFCYAKGYTIASETKEIASGMNSNRPKLNKLLKNPDARIIVSENRDRFTRFGYELINSSLESHNRSIILLN